MAGTLPDQALSSPPFYPQAIQLKLYQAFIFSVPILFSIILFLLFYLFYLKRRRNSSSPSPSTGSSSILPTSFNQQDCPVPLPLEVDLKEVLKEKLQIILFDEDLKAKESQCCVCLGEFEIKEQLHQIVECKHVFHIECIHHWLQANITCPLCRFSIVPARKPNPEPASVRPQLFPPSTSFEEQLQPANSEHVVIVVAVDRGSIETHQ